MKVATKNTKVYILSFDGLPLIKATLKGVLWDEDFEKWVYVINPLSNDSGYIKGDIDTCHKVMPTVCERWLNKGNNFHPKPYNIDIDSLPVYEYVSQPGYYDISISLKKD